MDHAVDCMILPINCKGIRRSSKIICYIARFWARRRMRPLKILLHYAKIHIHEATKGILHFQNGGYLFVSSGTRISLSQRDICLFLDLKKHRHFLRSKRRSRMFSCSFSLTRILIETAGWILKKLKAGHISRTPCMPQRTVRAKFQRTWFARKIRTGRPLADRVRLC